MSGIEIKRGTFKATGKAAILVVSPYHPDFPPRARALGGKWDGANKWWAFDARDEAAVRAALVETYGTDGTVSTDLVDVEFVLHSADGDEMSVFAFGREIAYRGGRDYPVRLGEGVRVVEGSFPSSGGSRNNPRILNFGQRVTLLVRDVPRGLAERERAVYGVERVRILGEESAASGASDVPEAFREAFDGPSA